jgi:hypothetical protein
MKTIQKNERRKYLNKFEHRRRIWKKSHPYEAAQKKADFLVERERRATKRNDVVLAKKLKAQIKHAKWEANSVKRNESFAGKLVRRVRFQKSQPKAVKA